MTESNAHPQEGAPSTFCESVNKARHGSTETDVFEAAVASLANGDALPELAQVSERLEGLV